MSATPISNALGQAPVEGAEPAPDDLRMWSVTTVIGALDKPALLYWSAEMAAAAAIDSEATWKAMLADAGREEAQKWLRDARFRRPKDRLASMSLGTVVHSLAEEYTLTGRRPDADEIASAIRAEGGRDVKVDLEAPVVTAMLDQLDGWLQRFSPTYEATEVTVYNPTYGYAGTLDAILSIDGVRFIADYKTSREHLDSRGQVRTPYPEQVALQLAAYRHAEHAAVWRPRRYERYRRRYYLLSPAEIGMAVPVPEVDTGLVIQISPLGCEAYPMECGPAVFDAFLYCVECFRWVQEDSTRVMGQPLEGRD